MKIVLKASLIWLCVFLLNAPSAWANVKPASPFGDHMVLQRDVPVPVWGTARPQEKVTVSIGSQKQTVTTGPDGKWMLRLAKMDAGGPYEMKITGQNILTLKDVYVGEVWVCSGQSNMDMTVAREDRYWAGVYNEAEEVAAANFPLIRMFDVDFVTKDEPQAEVGGTWEKVSPQTIGHLSAAAYFFARDLQKKLNVPIGLITTAYGASTVEAWTSRPALEANPAFASLLEKYQAGTAKYLADTEGQQKYAEAFEKWKVAAAEAKAAVKDAPRGPKNPDPRADQHSPAVLYNGMVAPLVPYAMRGVLWYQGESNGGTAKIYREQMEAMVQDWRQAWGQGDFPFIYVQLANHGLLIEEPVKEDQMVTVREAQMQNLSIPNTAMVVALDNANPDNPGDIHPKNKQTIGRRLALAARGLVYGEAITYAGPQFDKMTVEGNSIRLHLKNPEDGLAVNGEKLTGFAIAGQNKSFVWADARIEGNTIVVSSPEVPNPVAVRYAWAKNPPISLYNRAGLPASQFRTDNW